MEKHRESWSVVWACALGALAGSLLASEIGTHFQYGSYFWGIGALLGGLVAYVVVDFWQFRSGVVRSYHRAIAWRPHGLYWQTVGACMKAGAALLGSVLCYAVPVMVFAYYYRGSIVPDGSTIITPILLMLVVIGGIPVTVLGLVLVFGGFIAEMRWGLYDDEGYEHSLYVEKKELAKIYKNGNPLGVLRLVYRGIRFVVINIPTCVYAMGRSVKMITQFVAYVFVYVHSQRRTLCFVDATLGAIAGYLSGSAIVGALMGAVFGIINYELVSVRWLKLAPARTPNT